MERGFLRISQIKQGSYWLPCNSWHESLAAYSSSWSGSLSRPVWRFPAAAHGRPRQTEIRAVGRSGRRRGAHCLEHLGRMRWYL